MTRTLLLILFCYLLSGCITLYKPSTSLAIYDFGTPEYSQNESQPLNRKSKSILIADAAAPLWLDNTTIQYRLLYHNSTQTHTYTSSRWKAPPATLLARKIRDSIISNSNEQVVKNGSTAKTDYILHLELEEFIQAFDTINESHVVIGLRASLIERNSRTIFAQKDFAVTAKTPTADAVGAVRAFSSASNQLIHELIGWLTTKLPPQ